MDCRLFQEVSEEAACCLFRHPSALDITVVLSLAYASDFRIACLRVHEDQSADAGLRHHRVTFCQFDAQSVRIMSAAATSVFVLIGATVVPNSKTIVAIGMIDDSDSCNLLLKTESNEKSTF